MQVLLVLTRPYTARLFIGLCHLETRRLGTELGLIALTLLVVRGRSGPLHSVAPKIRQLPRWVPLSGLLLP